MADEDSDVEVIEVDAHEAEKEQVKLWVERIKAGVALNEKDVKDVDKWRRYVAGETKDNEDVYVNILGAQLDAMLPYIYANDPEIGVRPAESVGEQRYRVDKPFARTAEIILGREFARANLKHAVKREIRAGMTAGLGWFKIWYQTDIEMDPVIERRLNDAQDNLRRMQLLMEQVAENEDRVETERAVAEIKDQVTALSERVEITVAKGLVIEHVAFEDLIIDPGLLEAVDYPHGKWMAQRIWYTAEDARAAFGLSEEEVAKATIRTHDGMKAGVDDRRQQWYWVYEIWNKESDTVYTLLEGVDHWVRKPYPPRPSTTRFYPFFALAWHWVDGRRLPVADVRNWHNLQDEYTRTRAAFAEHRKRAVPSRIANGQHLSPADARKMTDGEILENIVLQDVPPGVSLDQLVRNLQYPPVDPGLYSTAPILEDLEQLSGLQDAARGARTTAKTATEASIQQHGLTSRMEERRDVVEAVIEDMARYALELCLQILTPADAARIAGPEAVWEQMNLDEIAHSFLVGVRAGTSGKPDQAREQQTWSTVFPMLMQAVGQIAMLRGQGQAPVADALTELLKETLRRLDVRVDLDEFLPPAGPQLPQGTPQGAPMPPGAGTSPGAEGGAIPFQSPMTGANNGY